MSIETVVLAVGSGGEERAERLADEIISVAGPADAEVVLTHVFDEEAFDDIRANLGFERGGEGATPDAVAERHTATRRLSETLSEAGVRHSVRGAVGELAEEVVGAAERLDADRVVVGGRQRSPTGKAVFGSAAQEVLLSAPCPVTFVREAAS